MKYKFTTTLNKDLVDALKIQAIKENRSVANIIDELVKSYLKQHSSHD